MKKTTQTLTDIEISDILKWLKDNPHSNFSYLTDKYNISHTTLVKIVVEDEISKQSSTGL